MIGYYQYSGMGIQERREDKEEEKERTFDDRRTRNTCFLTLDPSEDFIHVWTIHFGLYKCIVLVWFSKKEIEPLG